MNIPGSTEPPEHNDQTPEKHQRKHFLFCEKKIHIHFFSVPHILNMLSMCENICREPKQDILIRHLLLVFTVLAYIKLQSQSKNLNGV